MILASSRWLHLVLFRLALFAFNILVFGGIVVRLLCSVTCQDLLLSSFLFLQVTFSFCAWVFQVMCVCSWYILDIAHRKMCDFNLTVINNSLYCGIYLFHKDSDDKDRTNFEEGPLPESQHGRAVVREWTGQQITFVSQFFHCSFPKSYSRFFFFRQKKTLNQTDFTFKYTYHQLSRVFL